MEFRLMCGDAIEELRKLPDKSINTCVTSPPYYGLRDYGISEQIGLEETPEEYIDRLVDVFREVRRVLRDDGILWVNIGDSYVSKPPSHRNKPNMQDRSYGDYKSELGYERGKNRYKELLHNYKSKDLIGIPWMLAFALREDRWYLRQDIIWAKNNPMPESVKDRCTRSHEYIFMLTKSKKYYFDHEAMQEPTTTFDENVRDRDHTKLNNTPGRSRMAGLKRNDYKTRNKRDVWSEGEKKQPRFGGNKYGDSDDPKFQCYSGNEYKPTGMRNKRDVWRESVAITKEAHFAVFPKKLIEPCILAGCPENGWVLDPFSGSGTSGIVATNNSRNYIGIELNPEYIEITKRRVEKECTNVSIVENGQ